MFKIKMVVTDLDGTYFYNGMPMEEKPARSANGQRAGSQGVCLYG